MAFRSLHPLFTAIERLPFAPKQHQTWMNIYAPLCLLLIVFTAPSPSWPNWRQWQVSCSSPCSSGHALHGTYWHNNFGTPMSHGCVNLPMDVAEWMYTWAPLGMAVLIVE
jgi:hypothetical protein